MILERRPDDFAHRNLLLQAVLGLHAAGEAFDRLVAAHVPDRPGPPGEPDDATLALLGVVAFRERLRGHLDALPTPAAPGEPAPEATPRGLLR